MTFLLPPGIKGLKRVLQENKARKIFRKMIIFYHLIRTHTLEETIQINQEKKFCKNISQVETLFNTVSVIPIGKCL